MVKKALVCLYHCCTGFGQPVQKLEAGCLYIIAFHHLHDILDIVEYAGVVVLGTAIYTLLRTRAIRADANTSIAHASLYIHMQLLWTATLHWLCWCSHACRVWCCVHAAE
jgi:hypothetical protein